jgi:hypothetical protein
LGGGGGFFYLSFSFNWFLLFSCSFKSSAPFFFLPGCTTYDDNVLKGERKALKYKEICCKGGKQKGQEENVGTTKWKKLSNLQ